MRWHVLKPKFQRLLPFGLGGFQTRTVQSINIWKRWNCPPWDLPIQQLKLFILLDADILFQNLLNMHKVPTLLTFTSSVMLFLYFHFLWKSTLLTLNQRSWSWVSRAKKHKVRLSCLWTPGTLWGWTWIMTSPWHPLWSFQTEAEAGLSSLWWISCWIHLLINLSGLLTTQSHWLCTGHDSRIADVAVN